MLNSSASATDTRKALSAIFRSLPGSYSKTTLDDWRNGRKSAMPDPSAYESPEHFASDYLAYNLARKMEDDVFGVAPKQEELVKEAVSGFLGVENRLRHLNRYGVPSTPLSGNNPTTHAVIHTARRKISRLLGDFDANEMIAFCSFTSGASTRLRRKDGAPHLKFRGIPEVTRNCALLAVTAIWHSPSWRSYFHERFGRESDPSTWVRVVPGSEYFTVPKTTHSVRGAAKEPDMNLYLQKGIGTMIRRRLKRVRVDLDDQTRNQHLARVGSRTGSLATLDLSSASDSISLEVCRELLPADWLRFVMMTRSEAVKLPSGRYHDLQKVSSMGNGFTFELESLIFWALAAACVELLQVDDGRIGVYGDDVILHHSAYPLLVQTLEDSGFEVNQEKSWADGPFRESCGGHYYYGVDVSPFNVKKLLSDPQERYHLVNRYRMWAHRFGASHNDCADYLIRLLFPKGYVCVPPDLGTKAGMFVPNVGHAVGVFFSFEDQAYVTRALQSKTPQYEPDGITASFVWYMRAGEESLVPRAEGLCVRAPKRTRRGVDVVRARLRRYTTARWPDCEIGPLPGWAGRSQRAGPF